MLRTLGHPYVLLGLTALIWGANAVAGKLAVGHVSPMVLTLARWLFATLLLLPFSWRHLVADWPQIRPRLGYFALLGLLGFTGFNALFYVGLGYTTAIHAMIVQSSMPLVVFLGMFLLFRARTTALQVGGFALTLLGVLLTAAHGDPSQLLALDVNAGDAVILAAVLLFGGYTILLSRKPPLHWLSSITLISIAALVSSVPVALGEWALGYGQMPDRQGWAVIAFTVVFPSIVSQSFYIRGVELIGANRANLFINLVPIFGTILAVLVLGEALEPYHVAALALVLGGIAIAERGRRAERMVARPRPTDGV